MTSREATLPLSGGGNTRHVLYGFGAFCLFLLVGFALWIVSLGPPPIGDRLAFSAVVLDRDGKLLRPFATPDGYWRLPVRLADVDRRYVDLLVAYEDKRFRDHIGIDPYALLRAAAQVATHGHIVSGGSTLTMQVARLLEPRGERSLVAKLRQIVRAVEIERVLTKDEILALYLNLAPYGGNLEGVRAASLAWFGKEPRRLSLAQAALLVALPQSPEARRPDRNAKAAEAARARVLDRVAAAGKLAPEDIARAKDEPVAGTRLAMPMLAPHAAEDAGRADRSRSVHRLTIDAAWQASLEALARERAQALGPDVSVAILAVDNASGEVLAKVGSADYFDARRAGQVDMTRAVRSPGSTLKPFIYGIGFEDGIIHPETLIDDRPVRYGAYAPENFDQTFQGTVTVRRALQLSLNVPAVMVLDRVGASRLTARLAQAGVRLSLPQGEAPGLAMGLGGVGTTLADLVRLYAGIPRLGSTLPLRIASAERPATDADSSDSGRVGGRDSGIARRLMEPVAAWYVASTLIGTPPPDNAPPGRIAFKTGTSYGYRDAWAIGFDGRRTIGVWVGRADGAPVPGMAGRSAAAPVLFEAFARSGKIVAPLPPAPRHAIIASTARLPRPLQRFASAGAAAPERPRILFPPDGARLERTGIAGQFDPLAVKLGGGRGPLTVLVNGIPLGAATDKRTVLFSPDGPGFVRLTVMDSQGRADSVTVRVQ